MTLGRGMPPARRRLVPGLIASQPPPAGPADTPRGQQDRLSAERGRPAKRSPNNDSGRGTSVRRVRRLPSNDYAATRLVNFRLPTDLHDRYKQLVREVEEHFPRLRHPSLTELIIALLEEGPADAAEVAELIRRKRAGEHGASP